MKAIDLFAGFGGLTLGAEMAGVSVVWAANHDPRAVEVHRANHPTTAHACQDLRQADWTALPDFDLLLAAPACQGHSTASQPRRRRHHDALRGTAWAVIDCADATRPRAVVVENVLSFRRWSLYPLWRAALEALGYVVVEHEAEASWHEVPQLRRRLFVIAARRAVALEEEVAIPFAWFGDYIDASADGWRHVKDASPGARERMLAGHRRCGARFLSQHTTGHRGVPLCEPIRTITTKAHWVLVDGAHYRPLTARELLRAQGFPESFVLPPMPHVAACRGIGNAVPPPVARDVVRAVAEAA